MDGDGGDPPSTFERPTGVDRLDIRASTGLWAITSSGGRTCWVDLDAHVLIRWNSRDNPTPTEHHLVTVTSVDVGDHGMLRLGDRHEYVLDLVGPPQPMRLLNRYQVWVQGPITAIGQSSGIAIDT